VVFVSCGNFLAQITGTSATLAPHPRLTVMKKRRQPVQLHLLDRRPTMNRVWRAMPRSVQKEVIDLLATMMQQHRATDCLQ
jgi:hypothetical protein